MGCGDFPGCLGAANIPKDHAREVCFQLLLSFAGQLGHIRHIHTGFLGDRNGEGFAGGVHACYRHMGTDGALGEHIRLAFKVAILVQHLQRA